MTSPSKLSTLSRALTGTPDRCAVRSERALSDWFDITTDVRQGDIWSTLLLGLAIDLVTDNS